MTDADYEAYRADAQADRIARGTLVVDGEQIVFEARHGVIVWTPAGRGGGMYGAQAPGAKLTPSNSVRTTGGIAQGPAGTPSWTPMSG